jgi:hypothetical protein
MKRAKVTALTVLPLFMCSRPMSLAAVRWDAFAMSFSLPATASGSKFRPECPTTGARCRGISRAQGQKCPLAANIEPAPTFEFEGKPMGFSHYRPNESCAC